MTTHKEKELERMLKALANRRRLAIWRHLKKVRTASVSDLSSEIRLSLRSTSKHVNYLSVANLIDKDQKGHAMVCSLNKDIPDFARHLLASL